MSVYQRVINLSPCFLQMQDIEQEVAAESTPKETLIDDDDDDDVDGDGNGGDDDDNEDDQ